MLMYFIKKENKKKIKKLILGHAYASYDTKCVANCVVLIELYQFAKVGHDGTDLVSALST